MTDLAIRPHVRVPANTFGQEDAFARLGFTFRPCQGDDPIWQTAILPRGWRARALRPLTPVDIVDEHTRIRALITYGARPVLARDGHTEIRAVGRMRVVTLPEYLARCIANREPVIPDRTWATPKAIHETAAGEAERALRTAAEFRQRLQEDTARRYERLAATWSNLTLAHTPALETAA